APSVPHLHRLTELSGKGEGLQPPRRHRRGGAPHRGVAAAAGRAGRLTRRARELYLCRGMTALEEANLRRYYDQRAPEYEQIYLPRDEQHGRELGELSRELRDAVRGRRVL